MMGARTKEYLLLRWVPVIPALVLAGWYFWLGHRAARWPIYYENELLFRADTAEVADEICFRQSPANAEAFVHPLFTVLVKPVGEALYNLTGSVQTPSRLIAGGLGILAALFFWACVRGAGASAFAATAWTLLYGLSATPSVFSSIPERYAFGAVSQVLVLWAVVTRRRSNVALVATGLLSGGSALTNLAPWAILWFFARANDLPVRPWLLQALRMAGWSVVVVGLLFATHFIGSLRWPDTWFARNRAMMEAKGQFFARSDSVQELTGRADRLIRHLLWYPIAPPKPVLVVQPGGETVFTFTAKRYPPAGKEGIAAGIAWLILAGAALIAWRCAGRDLKKIGAGLVAALLFHFVLHLRYGDDFFLYTSHWHGPLLALVALPLASRTSPLACYGPAVTAVFAAIATVGLFGRLQEGIYSNIKEVWRREQPAVWATAESIAELLKKEQTSALYIPRFFRYLQYPLSSLGIETADSIFEPNPAKRIRAEAAGRAAVFEPDGNFLNFLEATGASASFTRVSTFTLAHNLKPSTLLLDPLDLSAVRDIRDSQGRSWRTALLDRDVYTAWSSRDAVGDAWLTVEFTGKVAVAAVRILPVRARNLADWEVAAWDEHANVWQTLTATVVNHGFSWEAGRVYVGGFPRFHEARFAPLETTALRITVKSRSRDSSLKIAALHLYTPGQGKDGAQYDFEQLFELLADCDPALIYADRFVTARLRSTDTRHHVASFRREHDYQRPNAPRHARFSIDVIPSDSSVAFVVPIEDAGLIREVLNRAGQAAEEHDVGGWRVFFTRLPADSKLEPYPVWVAGRLFEDPYIEAAPIINDSHKSLLASFRGVGRLHRVSLFPEDIRPGQRGKLETVWSFDRLPSDKRPGVFVHFIREGKLIFQADHALLQEWSRARMRLYWGPVRFKQKVFFEVPTDAPRGQYDMHIGLWLPDEGKRIRPHSTYARRDDAVVLARALRVEGPPLHPSERRELHAAAHSSSGIVESEEEDNEPDATGD